MTTALVKKITSLIIGLKLETKEIKENIDPFFLRTICHIIVNINASEEIMFITESSAQKKRSW